MTVSEAVIRAIPTDDYLRLIAPVAVFDLPAPNQPFGNGDEGYQSNALVIQ
jgi:hypothetical protein